MPAELSFSFIVGHYNYWMVVILMMTGLYIVVSRGNLIKKIVGLNLFQTSVFMLYISMGKIIGGTAPILTGTPDEVYSNPLPHVLILTAIVVGIATTALGLALVVRIRESFGTIEEDDLHIIEHEMEFGAAPSSQKPSSQKPSSQKPSSQKPSSQKDVP